MALRALETTQASRAMNTGDELQREHEAATRAWSCNTSMKQASDGQGKASRAKSRGHELRTCSDELQVSANLQRRTASLKVRRGKAAIFASRTLPN